MKKKRKAGLLDAFPHIPRFDIIGYHSLKRKPYMIMFYLDSYKIVLMNMVTDSALFSS